MFLQQGCEWKKTIMVPILLAEDSSKACDEVERGQDEAGAGFKSVGAAAVRTRYEASGCPDGEEEHKEEEHPPDWRGHPPEGRGRGFPRVTETRSTYGGFRFSSTSGSHFAEDQMAPSRHEPSSSEGADCGEPHPPTAYTLY